MVDRFDTSRAKMTWKQIDAECDYDVAKATASTPPGHVRYLERQELFIQCAELKGAKYVGKFESTSE